MSKTATYIILAMSIIVLFVGFTTSEIRVVGIGAAIFIFAMISNYAGKHKIKNLEEKGKELRKKLERFNVKAQKIGKVENAMIKFGFTCLFLGAILLGFVLMVVTSV